MTPTMDSMRTVVEALVEAGIRHEVKVIIGGAPTSQEFAVEIGADLHGMNAQEAVQEAEMTQRSLKYLSKQVALPPLDDLVHRGRVHAAQLCQLLQFDAPGIIEIASLQRQGSVPSPAWR